MKTVGLILLFFYSYFIQAQDQIIREFGPFEKLKLYDLMEFSLVKSDENKVVITGTNRANVQAIQKDETLKVRMDLMNSFSGSDTKVVIYYTERLVLIDANEGARVYSSDIFEQYDMEISAQEGAQIELEVSLKHLEARSVSGGSIEIKGNTVSQDVVINSGGTYSAKKLKSENGQISVSAGGYSELYCTESVKARVRAGGTINIYGSPKTVDKEATLGGFITLEN